MKNLVIVVVGMCLLLTSVPAMADQAADEAAIEKLMDELYVVYNKHDEKGLAALWGDVAIQYRRETKGKAAIEELIGGIFDRHKRSIQLEILEELGLTFVTPDVALVRQLVHFTKRYDSEGNSAKDRKAAVAWVLAKMDGRWQIRAAFESTVEE